MTELASGDRFAMVAITTTSDTGDPASPVIQRCWVLEPDEAVALDRMLTAILGSPAEAIASVSAIRELGATPAGISVFGAGDAP